MDTAEGGRTPEYCYTDRLCLQRAPGPGGACVDPEFCRWMEGARERQVGVCVYSDGSLWAEGPPEVGCGDGAHEFNPFCGGSCGDTCPVNSHMGAPHRNPGCFGVSETRGFGVCVPAPFEPCDEGSVISLATCSGQLMWASGNFDEVFSCACIRMAREPEGELPRWGVAVSEQTCLAYRARFPDQVSCRDRDWQEL